MPSSTLHLKSSNLNPAIMKCDRLPMPVSVNERNNYMQGTHDAIAVRDVLINIPSRSPPL